MVPLLASPVSSVLNRNDLAVTRHRKGAEGGIMGAKRGVRNWRPRACVWGQWSSQSVVMNPPDFPLNLYFKVSNLIFLSSQLKYKKGKDCVGFRIPLVHK